MRTLLLFLLVALGALLPAWAQAQAGPAPTTDTILRLDGQEIQGRVVVLTPAVLRYLPAAPAAPDTLTLPVAEVFMVRYANGTKEVLHPAPTTAEASADAAEAPSLVGLSAADRQGLGRRDAAANYRNSGAFWGAAGAAFGASPIYGIAAPIFLSAKQVKPVNFQAPNQTLLLDPSYQRGYQQQANSTKRKQAWAGYATGTGAWAVLFGALLIAVASSWH